VDLPIHGGQYYLVIASFLADSSYYNAQNVYPYPIPASFGELIAGAGWSWAPDTSFPPFTSQWVPEQAFGSPVAYYQTLVTGSVVEWLSIAPASGTVPAGQEVAVTVTFEPADTAPGYYGAEIAVRSNDPDEPEVVVPVSMRVVGPPN
jgi:hypothetical protein